MVISLSLTSLMAYVMMVPDFVLRKQLSVFLLITMFFSGGTVPTYLLIQNLGLYNSWWSLILPNACLLYTSHSSKGLSFMTSHLSFNSIKEDGEDLYSRTPSLPEAKSSMTVLGALE